MEIWDTPREQGLVPSVHGVSSGRESDILGCEMRKESEREEKGKKTERV